MTTLKEIKKAVNAALKSAYPDIRIYGADTVEGYTKPSLFVYATQTFNEATRNAIHKNVEIEIDFIQQAPNESEAMDFFATMERMFCHKLKLENRQLTTSNLSATFDGENKNIPCFEFEVEFWSAIKKATDNTPIAEEINMKQEVKTWDCQ